MFVRIAEFAIMVITVAMAYGIVKMVILDPHKKPKPKEKKPDEPGI